MLAYVAGLPPFFTLENNYLVRVTAQDATTGAVASSVIVSNVSISVDQEDSATSSSLPVDTPWLVPVAT